MERLVFTLLTLLVFTFPVTSQDPTVDEIIDGYLESIGGKAGWIEVGGIQLNAVLEQSGMEIPLEIVNFATGKTYTKMSIQGTDYYSNVYDGETLWGINFSTLSNERSSDEALYNFKQDLNDFPDAFLYYKRNGYKAEYLGRTTFRGVETYEVRLTKEPKYENGTLIEDVTSFFIDVETMFSIGQKTRLSGGVNEGMVSIITQGDFRKVDGLYFPFKLEQGMEGGEMAPIHIQSIQLNPRVDESIFEYPEEVKDTDKGN